MITENKRTENLITKVSPSEKAIIDLAAKNQGMTTSSYVRWIMLSHAKGNAGGDRVG